MADDWGRRKTLLDTGELYRVTRNAASPTGPDFKAGERVWLRAVGYSRYDNAHVYEFDTDDGVAKSYWLFDREPADALTATFQK
jgi:hypothetical protein